MAWPAKPQDSYGLEKLASEELLINYGRDFPDFKVAAVMLATSISSHRTGCGFYVAVALAYFANARSGNRLRKRAPPLQ